jgi:outer membrane protein assembly factor BamB
MPKSGTICNNCLRATSVPEWYQESPNVGEERARGVRRDQLWEIVSMNSASIPAPDPGPAPAKDDQAASTRATPKRPRFVWALVVLIAAFWSIPFLLKALDFPIYAGFFSSVGSVALLTLIFTIWWFTFGGGWLRHRTLVFVSLIAIGAVVGRLVDKSVGPIGFIFFGLPVGLSAIVVWLVITRNRSAALRDIGILATFGLVCSLMTVVRVDGIDGDQKATTSWRWTKSAEDLYLADRTADASATVTNDIKSTVKNAGTSTVTQPPLAAQPGDWTEFRGADRRGEVHGLKIATDWESHPPKQLWRHRIGPAWSSMLVIGDRLITQEQRGDKEAVVCLDASTGKEIWAHQDQARWFDGQAGAGPRSSPSFSDGRIYTLGGTGKLNCLDAASGNVCWTRDIAADSAAAAPMWGFSSTPLVVDGVVVVYAGGKGDKGLLAYRDKTGEPAWSAASGPVSYSSPQVVTVHGERQVAFLSDTGIVGLNPASGKLLWEHKAAAPQIWRVALPRQVDDTAIVFGSEDLGLVRIELAKAAAPEAKWDSHLLRPAYNDFVSQDGAIYGFDEGMFCCLDAATGKRRWKGGRYGHGQVLLIADQKILLVITETGEAVLVSARPDHHEELGRFQAINGKTWNHPAIAHGKLYVRNAEEIACYQLAPAK